VGQRPVQVLPASAPLSAAAYDAVHGGLSPGAPRGEENGNFKDGFWTCEAVQERRWAKEMVKLYSKGTDE
jgi:hypothetical protein